MKTFIFNPMTQLDYWDLHFCRSLLVFITRCPFTFLPVVLEAMFCGQKSLLLVWRCHQLLSGLIANNHFPRVSRQSRLSANDRGDDMIPGTVHRSPDIYLTAAISHRLNWDPLPPNEVGRIAQCVRKGGGRRI